MPVLFMNSLLDVFMPLFPSQFSNFDVLEMHFIPVVLQQDVSRFGFSECRPDMVFAVGYQCPPHLTVSFVLYYLGAIQPMFHMIALDNNPRPVPLADTPEWFVLWSGYQVVE
jgi:hypothetical protein